MAATDMKEHEAESLIVDEEIIFALLPQFGFSVKHIQNGIKNVTNKNDIFELKKYLENNVDFMAEWKEHQKKIEQERKLGVVSESSPNQTSNEEKESKENTSKKDKSTIKFPVQVFVRIRPLIKEEIDAKDSEIIYNKKYIKKTDSVTININDITKKKSKYKSSIAKAKKSKSNSNKKVSIKKFKGFKSILSATDDNYETFKQCILPSIDNIFNGLIVCAFAYGHTGSGKTHTILGYDKKNSPGMYRQTAKYINDKLETLNKNIENEKDEIILSCRFAELYQGKMRDLFGNLVECHVREDDQGNICIRGPTLKDEKTGQVKVQPLTPVYICSNETNKLIATVTESLKFRKQGSSAIHDESSRSHVFLEMELVSNALIEARTNLWNAEGELVPVGKEREDVKIATLYNKWIPDPNNKGSYIENPNWSKDNEMGRRLAELDKEFIELSIKIIECERIIKKVMNESDNSIGGSIVFVDLAGNEWGNDSKNMKNDKIQIRERKEINKSLLSLKECVRALHSHKNHVPYRDSKLTMVLRPHLKAINSTAIMIANISPSHKHVLKTYNTLSYSQLLAKA